MPGCEDCYYYGRTKDGIIGCSNPIAIQSDKDWCPEYVQWTKERRSRR